MSNYEFLFWFKSEDMFDDKGEYIGTAPGHYYVATSPKEAQQCRDAGGKESDNWEDYTREQYFADEGDY